ncbi:hypothetical protein PGB90_009813 [Kerria lacca]
MYVVAHPAITPLNSPSRPSQSNSHTPPLEALATKSNARPKKLQQSRASNATLGMRPTFSQTYNRLT